MAVPEEHGVQGWFLRAVVHGLTGLVFGLIVALVLVLLSDTGPMKWLARQGSDFGVRLYAWHSALLGVKLRAQGASFAFIDVNREACAKWIWATPDGPKTAEEMPGECNNPAKPPPDLLRALLKAAEATTPRVIIPDYALAEIPPEEELWKTLIGHKDSTPIIIAPAPTAPHRRGAPCAPSASSKIGPAVTALCLKVRSSTQSGSICTAQGRLRLASFMSWTDRAGATRVVRRYPATVWLEEMKGGELRILPSAPYLAAMLIADPTGTLADCVFYREVRLEPECNARRGDNLYDRYKDLLEAAPEKEESKALARVNEGQIFFTLLSIVPVGDNAIATWRSRRTAAHRGRNPEAAHPLVAHFPARARGRRLDHGPVRGRRTVQSGAPVRRALDRGPSRVPVSLFQAWRGPDTAQTAERGYAAILHLLESGALRLSEEVCAAAPAEFTANRRVNRLFRHYMLSGRCASLEDFLDMTQNGRAPLVEAELARLSEEPACAA